MNCGDYTYIWQAPDWPSWRYDLATLVSPLAQVSQRQGLLLGRLADIGLGLRDQGGDTELSSARNSALMSRRVIGWSMSSRIDRELATSALLMAVWCRQPKNTVMVHSGQGSQFISYDWHFLGEHNL
jgi:transposase InsO family protein